MKIGFCITARLKSSRLKRKILLPLNDGQTVLDQVIDRAKKIIHIDQIVICTSTHGQDSELENVALKKGVNIFFGSEDDVISRMSDAATKYKFDAIVSITADNPLFCIDTTNELVQRYKNEPSDFMYTTGIPIGCGTYVLDAKALKLVQRLKDITDTEIWGPLINRPDVFKVFELKVQSFEIEDDFRLTLDYPEDYTMFKRIFSYFDKFDTPKIGEVANLFNRYPILKEINEGKIQAGLNSEIADQIDEVFINIQNEISQFSKDLMITNVPGYSSGNYKIDIP